MNTFNHRGAFQRTALAIALGSCLLSAAAYAQDAAPAADPAKTQNLETVTVTGSRIRSVDVETAQPVFTLDQKAIKATGLTNVNEILARLPSTGTPDLTNQSPLSNGDGAGGTYVNIRNLGSKRTLVLVDGRRWSSTLGGLTDLSTIPVAIIERIDVLKDGASSIYGSDAIGGVVNIITKHKYDGADINLYFGENGKSDGKQKNAQFTWGHSTKNNSLILAASQQETDPMASSTRALTRYPQGPRHPNDGYGRSGLGVVTSPAGKPYTLNPGGNAANLADYTAGGAPGYNTQMDSTFRGGTKLRNLFVSDRYNLTDNITLHATGNYSVRDSRSVVAGYPFGSNSAPGLALSGQNAYNPFPGNDVGFARRLTEFPRETKFQNKVAHFDVGAEGFFTFLSHDWNWDATYTYSQSKFKQVATNNVFLPNARKALGPTSVINGQVACANAADRAAGCLPWNILAGPSAMSPALWNYLGYQATDRSQQKTNDFSANVGGGLFDLPGGTVSIAGGVEHRKESGSYSPDANDVLQLTTNPSSDPTKGSYIVNEAYLELDVPLLRDLPGAQELGVNVASRYSHYSNFGSTTNNKYSFRYRPIEDVLIRGTYAEGFRAPSIADLYQGAEQTFESYLDPCDSKFGVSAGRGACAAQGVPANFRQINQNGQPVSSANGDAGATPFTIAGNRNVKPEKSITRTAGIVYSPHYVQGLDFTLDFYKVQINNAITTLSSDSILNFCYIQNLPQFCQYVSRDKTGAISNLVESPANVGKIQTQGYDFGVHYRLPETSIGTFAVYSDSSYLKQYDETPGPGSAVRHLAGYMVKQSVATGGVEGQFRVRSNLSLNWDYQSFGASWTMRYFSGLKDSCYDSFECSNPTEVNNDSGQLGVAKKGSVTFNDAQFRYRAPWNATFSVGVNNVFNRKGPFYYRAASSGIPPYYSGFDIDRFFYVSYDQKF
ncbi:TonB-dependent receptor [Luteibacter anthropi]|uniref:TonB-dependent receptor n=1 Tax=Luteibacter anthropi TaxID=564369 RepID=A0A7X5U7Q5_9GAMM|nr:TonB-dependent receptor [Luteibacter anthropi]NII05369.1 TonB-dependent receptor [Luteibacter anthropi]URX61618.1 TonB-dependent receptor [Luteibacter anthropi]